MALTGDTGNGATLTFAANMGFGTATTSMTCITINQGEQTIKNVDVTTLATTDCEETIPGDLRSVAESTATFKWLTTTTATVANYCSLPASAGAVVVTAPMRTGETTAATFTGTAFVNGFTPPSFANGELQTGQVKWKYDGDTGPGFTGSA